MWRPPRGIFQNTGGRAGFDWFEQRVDGRSAAATNRRYDQHPKLRRRSTRDQQVSRDLLIDPDFELLRRPPPPQGKRAADARLVSPQVIRRWLVPERNEVPVDLPTVPHQPQCKR